MNCTEFRVFQKDLQTQCSFFRLTVVAIVCSKSPTIGCAQSEGAVATSPQDGDSLSINLFNFFYVYTTFIAPFITITASVSLRAAVTANFST